jgi:hypothetical protein
LQSLTHISEESVSLAITGAKILYHIIEVPIKRPRMGLEEPSSDIITSNEVRDLYIAIHQDSISQSLEKEVLYTMGLVYLSQL